MSVRCILNLLVDSLHSLKVTLRSSIRCCSKRGESISIQTLTHLWPAKKMSSKETLNTFLVLRNSLLKVQSTPHIIYTWQEGLNSRYGDTFRRFVPGVSYTHLGARGFFFHFFRQVLLTLLPSFTPQLISD